MAGQEPDVGPTPLKAMPAIESTDGSDLVAEPSVVVALTGLSSNDEERFRLVFSDTYQPLVAYARRRVSDHSEADDVVSEAFAVAWRRRSELDTDLNPLPWLYGIAANVIRNQWRSQSRRLRLVDQLEHQPQSHRHEPDPSDRPGQEIRSALAELSFDDQEVLRLSAWEGLSHAEIGEVLGCSENAVGIRVHRARNRLKEQLAVTDQVTEKDQL